jgi:hypothetical protein
MLRRIYGRTCENGVWRIKYNDELCGLCKEIRAIKVDRIRWLGHLEWRRTHLAKKVTFSQPESSRKKGKTQIIVLIA